MSVSYTYNPQQPCYLRPGTTWIARRYKGVLPTKQTTVDGCTVIHASNKKVITQPQHERATLTPFPFHFCFIYNYQHCYCNLKCVLPLPGVCVPKWSFYTQDWKRL